MAKESRTHRLVEVTWLDHEASANWLDSKDIQALADKECICTSIGRVAYEDKNCIILCLDTEGDDWGTCTKILKANITKERSFLRP